MIKVQELTKKYGEKLAVDHLTFGVKHGDILGFLGPNGAGKSTTMNMLTGFLSPTDGTILIDEINMQEEPEEAKKKIGYLPEIPPLYTELTVMEYLRFVMRLKKIRVDDTENYLRRICQRTGIEQVRGRLIRHLSKGYRQRVGIAQTLVGNPPILILDEPTVGLDPKQIMEIRTLIRNLGNEHTIILSSHILQEIQAVCNRIIIINEGKMVLDQEESELLGQLGKGKTGSRIRSYCVEIKGDAERVSVELSKICGVQKVSFENHLGAGIYAFELQSTEDIRERIFDLTVQKKWKLLRLEEKEYSLESIFLHATQKK